MWWVAHEKQPGFCLAIGCSVDYIYLCAFVRTQIHVPYWKLPNAMIGWSGSTLFLRMFQVRMRLVVRVSAQTSTPHVAKPGMRKTIRCDAHTLAALRKRSWHALHQVWADALGACRGRRRRAEAGAGAATAAGAAEGHSGAGCDFQ